MSTFSTVAKLMAERLEIDVARIQPDSELESLGADSLTLIELVFDLEDQFGISLGDERPTLVVVQDIVDTIDRFVGQKKSD
ncbi:MAG TPA: phosphopantetheine-binding protein [Janthinobacterium sp.]|nr:phosphopantetheine-binding protein [Janthinobacterium sp.]